MQDSSLCRQTAQRRHMEDFLERFFVDGDLFGVDEDDQG